MDKFPLLQWVVDQFHESPILTVVIGLIVLAIALYLLKNAIRLLLILIALALLAVLASYLFRGEEETTKTLEDLGRKAAEEIEERGILEPGAKPEEEGGR